MALAAARGEGGGAVIYWFVHAEAVLKQLFSLGSQMVAHPSRRRIDGMVVVHPSRRLRKVVASSVAHIVVEYDDA